MLCSDLELRDQYHAEFNPKNQETLCSYFHNLFLILDGQRRMEQGIKAALRLPKKVAGFMDRIQDPLAGVTPMPGRWAQSRKIKVDIAPQVITDEEMAFRIPDTDIAEDLAEDMIQREKDAFEEAERAKVKQQAEKAVKEYEKAEKEAVVEAAKAKQRQQEEEEKREKAAQSMRDAAAAMVAARESKKKAEPGSPQSPQSETSKPQQPPRVIKPVCIENHVSEYSYVTGEDQFGSEVEMVQIDGKNHQMVVCSEKDLNCPYLRYSKSLDSVLTQVNKVLRGHGKCGDLPFETFATAFKREVPAACGRVSVQDLCAICFRDKKGRFEVKAVEDLAIGDPHNLKFWPFKIRAVQGHSGNALKDRSLFHGAMKMYYMPSRIDTDTKALIGASSAAVPP